MDCALCHASLGGAHAVHAAFASPADSGYGDQRILEDFSPSGGPAYQFGCGNCHPLDPARHLSGGPVEVSLSPAAAGATGLRALNRADAAYAGGKCSGVYCHSSGQATPIFVETPAWTSAPGHARLRGVPREPAAIPVGRPGGAGRQLSREPRHLRRLGLGVRPLRRHARRLAHLEARRLRRHGFAAGPRPRPSPARPATSSRRSDEGPRGGRLLLLRPRRGYDLQPAGDADRVASTRPGRPCSASPATPGALGSARPGGAAPPRERPAGRVFDPRVALPDGYPAGSRRSPRPTRFVRTT